jgi:hypothetical protein
MNYTAINTPSVKVWHGGHTYETEYDELKKMAAEGKTLAQMGYGSKFLPQKLRNELKQLAANYRRVAGHTTSKRVQNLEHNSLHFHIKVANFQHVKKSLEDYTQHVFGTSYFKNQSREVEIMRAKHFYCAFRRCVLKHKYKDIAKDVGSHHATIIHSVKAFLDLYETDKGYRAKVDSLVKDWAEKNSRTYEVVLSILTRRI